MAALNKKGLLISILTIILMLSVFYISTSFLERTKAVSHIHINSVWGPNLNFLFDDLAHTSLEIQKVATISITDATLTLENIELNTSFQTHAWMTNYSTFLSTFSDLQNIELTTTGFNNTFDLHPQNSSFEFVGPNLSVFTMPSSNPVSSISLTLTSQDSAADDCVVPTTNDGAVSITVTHITTDYNCTITRNFDPDENNDIVGGENDSRQFFLDLTAGSVEIKYGTINSVDGVLHITTSTTWANISHLNITYTSAPTHLSNGIANITLIDGTQKNAQVKLYE